MGAKYNLKKSNLYNYENMDRIADNRTSIIVYVVTPPGLHRVYDSRRAMREARDLGKTDGHFVEDCTRMIDACKAAKVKLGIGYRVH